MPAPFFSVVIPTRERASTLLYTLKTCVTQNYKDVEFLVSNNASTDNTEDVVRSFNDPRIRLINTGRRVSMRENWEFALEQVQGSYVIFIGDDDALLPDALESLANLLSIAPADAIKWDAPTYYWPGIDLPFAGEIIYEPRHQSACVNSHAALAGVRWGYLYYHFLPMIYHGVVSADHIRQVKAKTGKFFLAENPDVYSGVVVAATSKSYIYLHTPQTISGASRFSTGADSTETATLRPDSPRSLFYKEIKLEQHKDFIKLSDAPASVHACVTDAMLRARDGLKYGVPYVPLWYRLFLILRETAQKQNANLTEPDHPLRQYAKRLGLGWLYSLYLSLLGSKIAVKTSNSKNPFVSNRTDLRKFNVSDVFGAASLFKDLWPSHVAEKPQLRITTHSLLAGRLLPRVLRSPASSFFVSTT